jgi:hypothetical protein
MELSLEELVKVKNEFIKRAKYLNEESFNDKIKHINKSIETKAIRDFDNKLGFSGDTYEETEKLYKTFIDNLIKNPYISIEQKDKKIIEIERLFALSLYNMFNNREYDEKNKL